MESRKFNGLDKGLYAGWSGGELLGTCLRFVVCLTVLVVSQNTPGAEQTGGEVAVDLKPNVVRITTTMADSSTGPGGFGFIVGEKNRYLYIVTAKHVVVGENLDNLIDQRHVRFFGQTQEKPARAEYLGAAPPWDLALLKVAKPRDLVWQPQSMAPEGTSQRDTRVWYIGVGADWRVPTDAGAGTINRPLGEGKIDIDMPGVRVGTSGAPLITRDGIAGMVLITGEGKVAEALSIDAIKSAFDKHNRWEAYPWSLRSFPPCHGRPAGLVHWWPGDGNANDTVGDNHGKAEGSVSYVPGKVGKAFAFDGMDSYVASSAVMDRSGNKSRTARQLGISRSTLREKMKLYGIAG